MLVKLNVKLFAKHCAGDFLPGEESLVKSTLGALREVLLKKIVSLKFKQFKR